MTQLNQGRCDSPANANVLVDQMRLQRPHGRFVTQLAECAGDLDSQVGVPRRQRCEQCRTRGRRIDGGICRRTFFRGNRALCSSGPRRFGTGGCCRCVVVEQAGGIVIDAAAALRRRFGLGGAGRFLRRLTATWLRSVCFLRRGIRGKLPRVGFPRRLAYGGRRAFCGTFHQVVEHRRRATGAIITSRL